MRNFITPVSMLRGVFMLTRPLVSHFPAYVGACRCAENSYWTLQAVRTVLEAALFAAFNSGETGVAETVLLFLQG